MYTLCCGRHIVMFRDRAEAGRKLGHTLLLTHQTADIVVGLTHGGVAVSSEISGMLYIPQGVLAVKKIGSPGNPELAIGAVVAEKQHLDVKGKTVILADDGAATGWTMTAAVKWIRNHGAKKIIVVLPVAPPDVAEKLRALADSVVLLSTPADFGAVGEFYTHFPQLTDQDVIELLA